VPGQWRAGVARALDGERAGRVLHQPDPARAEQPQRGALELLAQPAHIAEVAGHQFAQPVLRVAAAARVQALEVERVVPGLGGGIEQAALALPHDVLQRQVGQLGAFDARIDRIDVGALVAAVVQVQRFGRQVWLQGGAVVGQAGQVEGHGSHWIGDGGAGGRAGRLTMALREVYPTGQAGLSHPQGESLWR